MFFKKMWLVVTGDWGSREVHDSAAFNRFIMAGIALVIFTAVVGSIPSCNKHGVQHPHIYNHAP